MAMPDNGDARPPDGGTRRIDRTLLSNKTRRRIIELVRGSPGMNNNQIAKALGLRPTLVIFHADRLEEVGLLERRAGWSGRETYLFTPENAHLWEEESTRLLYGRAPVRPVALYLADNPGAQTHEIAEVLGMSVRTAREHVRILHERGLVDRVQVEQWFEYYADESLVTWAHEMAGDSARDWEEFDRGEE